MDHIEVVNLIPKFLTFYKKVKEKTNSEQERWKLWEEWYQFAAVPPGDDGKKLARTLLNEAWDKYAEHIDYIERWSPDQQHVESLLKNVKELLGVNEPIRFVIVYFVGGFENNPFVAPFDQERLALCLPVENGRSDILLAHELTHIVHSKAALLSSEWERSIASTILQEGLATQVSKYLVPGRKDQEYIEHTKSWLNSCEKNKIDIYEGIYPFLEDSSSESVFQFTMGKGTTNHEREAYFVGWKLVQILLEEGLTFKELAHIMEKDIPNFIKENFNKLYSSD